MKKLISACAVCAVAVGVVVAPAALGKAQTKEVVSTVAVSATPSTVTPSTTSVSVSGNVASNSSCRKDRTIEFAYVNGATVTPVTPLSPTPPITTKPNGDFSATLPTPTDVAPATVTLRATVLETTRTKKIKGKNKGANKGKKKGKTQKRKFHCQAGDGTTTIAVSSS